MVPLLGIHPWEMKTSVHTKTRTQMFIAALFITVKNWKQIICPSTDEWINKLWTIQTMEHDAAMKRNKLWKHTVPWMHLKGLMSSERSQSQNATCCVLPFIWKIYVLERAKVQAQKPDECFSRAVGVCVGGWPLGGSTREFFGGDGTVLYPVVTWLSKCVKNS